MRVILLLPILASFSRAAQVSLQAPTIDPKLRQKLDVGQSDDPAHDGWPDHERVQATAADAALELGPMTIYPLHVSGRREDRVNLMFFADGYTPEEEDQFVSDAQRLSDDIVSGSGAMSHVADLMNVWAAYVPSNISGIGTHDTPLPGAAFGLYRPGDELRAVFVDQPKRARAACGSVRKGQGPAGCDQPILLGNDPLYGGLGGEFTIITASELNGPLVLRHELGHSLIPVGEEYEGGYAYFGANSEAVEHVANLTWREFLTDPDGVRVEDVKVPLQVWFDLDQADYAITFNDSTAGEDSTPYPTALVRLSLSSIPYPSHVDVRINDQPLNLTSQFPLSWAGSLDRRWVEVPLPMGLNPGSNHIQVGLTEKGRLARAGQGGKMLTSLEVIEYGVTFNHEEGFVGAFPTYALDGSVTLRPTNEGCLMRKVNHPHFCAVCAHALRINLQKIIRDRKG
ncbi:hypothetical protein IAU60_003256 [Kwoniella sp. DSM 27419]